MNYNDIAPKLDSEPVKNVEAVMQSMGNILATTIGSVPGHPEFGCGIDKFLFEQIDLLTIQLIKEEVKYALGRWEPRIKVLDIDVQEDLDYNRVNIKIIFYIINDPDNPEREYVFSAKN